jgi:RNA polymerase sigma-70 factor (ECF subfamily)
MAALSQNEITRLLRAWSGGDQTALERLTPLIHQELHRAAHRYMMSEQPGHTLQTAALVNEVYVRLLDARDAGWQDRAHFFAICAQLMRNILVDHARSRQAIKRGGAATRVSLDDAAVITPEPSSDLLAVDAALKKMAEFDARKSQVVELRFFGGLNIEETAEVLNVSTATVARDWKLAKAWLLQELSLEQSNGA